MTRTALLAEIGQPPPEQTKDSEAGVSKYKQVLRIRSVHVMAFFIFVYVGVESSIGGTCLLLVPDAAIIGLRLFSRCVHRLTLTPPGTGWIVTYIINERNGGSNSGYISSGFWGGLTAGRIFLLWFNKKVRPPQAP